MSLSAVEIGEVVAELGSRWTGAQIQKIHMRGPRTVMMKLRVPGASGVLRISVEPSAAHLCVVEARGEADEAASAFCMLLRKRLKGGRLARFEQVGDDRLVALGGPRGLLYAELTGRRGRFVLCDEKERVLSFTPPDAARDGLARGRLWTAPEGGGGSSRPSRFVPGSINDGVVEHYGDAPTRTQGADLRRGVAKALKKRLARATRRLRKIEGDLERVGDPEVHRHHGELLKANLYQISRGDVSITVEDWLADGATVEIPLDPRLEPSQNLTRLFEKARKATRGREIARARLDDARRAVESEEEQIEGLEGLDDEAVAALSESLVGAMPSRRRGASRKVARLPYKKYADEQGRPILVGRSAGDNDRLTVQIARPDDLWLHARDVHGSHVVVPLQRGEEIDQDRFIDAATLAAHFSEARGNTTVEVRYTRRRHVQKPKGTPPGTVLVLREKVLNLRVELDRLERLLSTRQDG